MRALERGGQRAVHHDGRERPQVAAGELVHVRADPHAHLLAVARVVGVDVVADDLAQRHVVVRHHLAVGSHVACGQQHALGGVVPHVLVGLVLGDDARAPPAIVA